MNDNCDGLRIVNLKELGTNMKCKKCKRVLDLQKVSKERLIGCHSVLTIHCESCDVFTQVNTAKVVNKDISEVNAGLVLGAMHSGAGQTSLDKILACANAPPKSNYLLKNYEKLIGKIMEDEAKASCQRAAIEERELVIKNIKKLIQEL
ncbi:uncharacterized protein LOC117179516 [Belonocnema kinseyi]|uniref:uncharacterized protein LOC117179516 n=1 Tax=Belonocnema kinseyi TaxID=2817044 RepID=UPI00143D4A3B|nr:uncharacterized protein LOC117179516 [Belonocnema kinseyi]